MCSGWVAVGMEVSLCVSGEDEVFWPFYQGKNSSLGTTASFLEARTTSFFRFLRIF